MAFLFWLKLLEKKYFPDVLWGCMSYTKGQLFFVSERHNNNLVLLKYSELVTTALLKDLIVLLVRV